MVSLSGAECQVLNGPVQVYLRPSPSQRYSSDRVHTSASIAINASSISFDTSASAFAGRNSREVDRDGVYADFDHLLGEISVEGGEQGPCSDEASGHIERPKKGWTTDR
jgi:hypothetical protein